MNYKARLEKIGTLLNQESLKGLIVDRPIDLYYLTGVDLSSGRLVIDPQEATLCVDGRYYEACKQRVTIPVLLTNGYEPESAFANWWKLAGERVGFDADHTSFAEYERLSQLSSQLIPLKQPLKKIREIKDKKEMAALQQAAELGSAGYDFLLTQLVEGVSEINLVQSLEIFWLERGCDRVAFPPHIAFGEGSSQPHYRSGNRKLKKGDIVLMDIGVVLDHYHSDMTRVVFYGHPRPELESIYHIVYEAYRQAILLCQPGTLIGEIDRAARSVIERAGYKEFFTHGLGHGVGLEIHEMPSLRTTSLDLNRPLEAGMVLTIEPGIYLPQIGGVRLEDTLLIIAQGHLNLTQRPLSPSPLIIPA